MPNSAPFTGINLLRYKPLRELVRWRGFPYVFIVLVALDVASWHHYASDGGADGLYARTNLVQVLICVYGGWR
jgi:hypothetical protein